jgi:hypothetical protein
LEALRKKERQDETWFTTKIARQISLGPNLFQIIKSSNLIGLKKENLHITIPILLNIEYEQWSLSTILIDPLKFS